MKTQNILFGLLLIAAFAFLASFEAGPGPAKWDSSQFAAPPALFKPAATIDTITNAENDTITLTAKLYSQFQFNWTVITTQLSGTQSINAIVQESASDSDTDWYPVDTVALSGSADLDRIVGTAVYGVRQRLIIDGSGTQSTRYRVYPVFKYGQY